MRRRTASFVVALCAAAALSGCSDGAKPSLDARPEISMQFRYLESTDPKSPNCLKTRSQNPDANEQAIVTDSTHCMLVGPAKWTIRHVLDADVDVKESKAGRIVIKVLPMSQPDLDAVRKLADDADGKDIAVLFQGRLYGPMPAGELTRDREIRVTTDLAEPLARYVAKLMSASVV